MPNTWIALQKPWKGVSRLLQGIPCTLGPEHLRALVHCLCCFAGQFGPVGSLRCLAACPVGRPARPQVLGRRASGHPFGLGSLRHWDSGPALRGFEEALSALRSWLSGSIWTSGSGRNCTYLRPCASICIYSSSTPRDYTCEYDSMLLGVLTCLKLLSTVLRFV